MEDFGSGRGRKLAVRKSGSRHQRQGDKGFIDGRHAGPGADIGGPLIGAGGEEGKI